MTTMQINAEINRNLNYLGDSNYYLQKVLDFLKRLSKQKSEVKAASVEKMHVEDGPLPTDKYLGMFSPSKRDDDERLKEEYIREKYSRYL